MRRRAKSAREPRGLLRVPVLSVPVLEDSESPPPAARDPEPAAEARAPSLPPQPVERAEPAAPRPAPAEGAPRRSVARVAGFVALLVVLAVAGLLVGRLARDGGESETAKPATSAASTSLPAAPAPSGERWGPLRATAAGRLASPAVRAAAAIASNRVVVIGGTVGAAVQLGVPGGVVRRVGTLPAPRASAAVFVGKGAAYLIGGEHGGATPSDELLRIDLVTHRVTPAGSFVEPLAGAGYVQSGNSLLIVGGWTGERHATAVLRFSLPDQAEVVARLPEAVRDPAVALRGGKLYVAGGRTATGLSRAVYVVELASGSVSVLGQLPQAVAGASLVVAGGQLYVLGGRGKAGPVATVVHIDPATGRIEPAGRMPRPLAGAATVQVGRATLVIGGTRATAVYSLESR